MKLSGSTSRPPAGWRANVSMVRSMSPRSCTGPAVDSIDSDLAHSSSSFTRSAPPAAEVSRLNSSATRVTPGAIALSNSSHLPLAGKSKLISGPDQGPAFLHLAAHISFGGVMLGIERVEILLQPIVGGDPGIDGAANPLGGPDGS